MSFSSTQPSNSVTPENLHRSLEDFHAIISRHATYFTKIASGKVGQFRATIHQSKLANVKPNMFMFVADPIGYVPTYNTHREAWFLVYVVDDQKNKSTVEFLVEHCGDV